MWLAGAVACVAPPVGAVERELAITATDRYLTEGGEELDRGLHDVLEAWSWSGGEWLSLEVERGVEDARVAAPPGPVYLRHGAAWIATSADAIDLGRVRLGRTDLTPAAPATRLEIIAQSLVPWQADHQFQLYSAGTALWSLGAPAVAMGADSFHAAFDFGTVMLPAVQRSRGDDLWFAQLTTAVLDGTTYAALARSAELEAEMVDGTTVVLEASLDAPPASELAIDYRIAEFDRVRFADQPVIATSWYDVGVAALLGAGEHGHYDVAADLAIARFTDHVGRDLAGPIAYGDPFPASWTRMATFVAWYPVTVGSSTVFDAVWTRNRADAIGAVEPLVGAPRDVRVEDRQVRWRTPERGAAAGYRVAIYALDGTGVELAGEILTTERQVRIPPGILPLDQPVAVVQVTAIAGPMDLGATPFALGLPYGEASIARVIIRP